MIRLYFYGPPTSKSALREAYTTIKDVCGRADVLLSTNTEAQEVNLPSETVAEYRAAGAPLLDAMHAVIIEGTTPDPQAGYLLAYALAERKPLLYLYERGEAAPEVLRYMNLKDVPKHIMIATYRPETLEATVTQFLGTLGQVKVREVPRIKFTLRLTSSIDEYLDYKTRNTKASKADYLREEIERQIERDEQYQHYRKKRRS